MFHAGAHAGCDSTVSSSTHLWNRGFMGWAGEVSRPDEGTPARRKGTLLLQAPSIFMGTGDPEFLRRARNRANFVCPYLPKFLILSAKGTPSFPPMLRKCLARNRYKAARAVVLEHRSLVE